MQKDYEKSFFSTLENNGVAVPQEIKLKIQRKIDEMLSYQPRIGVFGKTGVGKSSLCNALFGQDVCPISNVEACTRDPQDVLLTIGSRGLKLIDVPGVGESGDRDVEYAALYHKLLPELDVVLWVLKGDDRAFSSDESFYKQVVKPHMDQGKPFFIVLNQVDKIDPFREWDLENRRPSASQLMNIQEKIRIVSTFFDVPMNHVIPVSANEKYGLIELTDSMIYALPREKQISLSKSVPLENLSEKAIKEAEKGLFDTLVDFASHYVPVLKPIVNVARKAWNLIFGG